MDEGGQRHEPPDCVRYKPNGGSDDGGGGGGGHHRRVENHISGLTRFHISILKANRKQKGKKWTFLHVTKSRDLSSPLHPVAMGLGERKKIDGHTSLITDGKTGHDCISIMHRNIQEKKARVTGKHITSLVWVHAAHLGLRISTGYIPA